MPPKKRRVRHGNQTENRPEEKEDEADEERMSVEIEGWFFSLFLSIAVNFLL